MFVIRVTSCRKEILPEMMVFAIQQRLEYGTLDGLIHIKDDVTRETDYGWEMLSYWGTPEKVNTQIAFRDQVETVIHSTDDLREAVSALWALLADDESSDIEQFRQDVLDALQGSPENVDAFLNVVDVLIEWSDRLDV